MSGSADSAYAAELRAACGGALARQPQSFEELVPQLAGADPTAALATLTELARTNQPYSDLAACLAEEARRGRTEEPRSIVPVPHPLDYAWPFSVSARTNLLTRLGATTAPGDVIVYVGTPTLHATACDALPNRRHLLVDRDLRHIERAAKRPNASVVAADLLSTPPSLEPVAAVAVVDPPWYPDEALRFVAAAVGALRPGGLLLLSFASRLTRPGAGEDQDQVVAGAEQQGLDLVTREHAALQYATPPFEYAALRAAGITCVPPEWRVADLIEMRRTRKPSAELPPIAAAQWLPADVGDLPLRVRPDAPPTGNSLLAALVAGEILPSVSRREPLRAKAALWSARNRVFTSNEPPLLARIAAAVSRGGAVPGGDRGAAAARRLRALAETERVECGLVALVDAEAR